MAFSDQLKNATHFAIYVVYFSNRKISPLSGSWKHSHKIPKGSQSFHIQRLPFLLQVVTKISTVYKFHEERVAVDFAILRDETELVLGTKRVKL